MPSVPHAPSTYANPTVPVIPRVCISLDPAGRSVQGSIVTETVYGLMKAGDESAFVKGRALAAISHELRTPLGAILGFAELLLDRNQTEPERVECVHAIRRNGRLLLSIINDILDFSKFESGRMQLEDIPCSTNDLLNELRTLFRGQAHGKGVTFDVEIEPRTPPMFRTDPTRLRQILINLISNAVKFTPAGGSVSVRISHSDGLFIARVHDTGCGISPDDAAHLFVPFAQADASITRRYGGTGLGLALARNLARALGGDVILAESGLGLGSVFEATVQVRPHDPDMGFPASHDPGPRSEPGQPAPFATSSSCLFSTYPVWRDPAPASRTDAGKPLEHVEVLVVDDSADSRTLIKRLLEREGAHVTLAHNGQSGQRLALSGHFDVVLMDMEMPVQDGWTATRELRQQGYQGPIVALTAHALLEERERCLSAGCDCYISKPIDHEALTRILKDALQKDLHLDL